MAPRALVFTLSLALLPSAAFAAEWQEVARDRGITVWRRAVEGSSLVEFRGRGTIQAPVIKIAAVLHNSGREREWMQGCAESRVLERLSPIDAIVYNRTASPIFFVSDRDVVVEARTTVVPDDRTLNITFRSVKHPKAPPADGAVRMPAISGRWSLRALNSQTTEVVYELKADPGGALPAWIVNWATESIPLDTIAGLRTQVTKTGYDEDIRVLERAIDWTAFRDTTLDPRASIGGAGGLVRANP